MDCRQALSSLADLSADQMSSLSLAEMRAHLEKCPECEREWQLFQSMLHCVSTTSQPLMTQAQSRQCWAACLDKIMNEVERDRVTSRAVPETESRAWWQGWLGRQPNLGWAALGGALAVLGGVWFFGPQDEAAPANYPVDTTQPRLIRFENPPSATTPLVNHHTGMAFDAFNDHVGSTLVSYSATASE